MENNKIFRFKVNDQVNVSGLTETFLIKHRILLNGETPIYVLDSGAHVSETELFPVFEEYKFDLWDPVYYKNQEYKVRYRYYGNKAPWYLITGRDGELRVSESELKSTPAEIVFEVGSELRWKSHEDRKVKVVGTVTEDDGEISYILHDYDGSKFRANEKFLTNFFEKKGIMSEIKTFLDACAWCEENGEISIVEQYTKLVTPIISNIEGENKDIIAYLKLRIITLALNEGWKPEEDESIYIPTFAKDGEEIIECYSSAGNSSPRLGFKNRELAEYARNNFEDIYLDFCK